MTLPTIATRADWLDARRALLAREKELTRARDALNTARRELPMVRVEKQYTFTGPDGPVTLLDLFGGHRQLIVGHFMFDPEWTDGCPSCSAGVAELAPGLYEHLAVRDTALVHVSRAPLSTIEAYKARKGWTIPWISSHGSEFNYDFHATVDPAVTPPLLNFAEVPDAEPGEVPGTSCFLRDGDDVFHTYSSYARGAEWTGGSYAFLDLTALGRQEDWEEPKGRADLPRGNRPDFTS
jgi:predicted dithiol-disulfide oxidoreductase (DUF899 family)